MLKIRPVDQTDLDAVSRIIRESFAEQIDILGINQETVPNFVAFETSEGVRRRVAEGDRVLLGFVGSQPVGTISCRFVPDQPGPAHIKRFAILPGHRGQGHGKILMESAENDLRELGAEIVEIAIVASFTRLQQYYQNLGYKIKEKKRFQTVPFEVLFLNKAL